MCVGEIVICVPEPIVTKKMRANNSGPTRETEVALTAVSSSVFLFVTVRARSSREIACTTDGLIRECKQASECLP